MTRIAAVVALFVLFLSGGTRSETWPPPAPDLAVTLLPQSGDCTEGDECRFILHFSNEGSAPFEGRVGWLHHSTVPGVPAGAVSCRKRDFNTFACDTSLSLAPHAVKTIALAVRMLATPRSEAEHCVSLAGTADPVSADDQSCVTVRLGLIAEQSECEVGETLINDRCVQLAKYCTAGRSWNAASGSCACPADRPLFDRPNRNCAVALAAVECSGGRVGHEGGCYCPMDRPWWDSASLSCRSDAKPVNVVIAAPVVPKPVVTIPDAPKQVTVHAPAMRKLATPNVSPQRPRRVASTRPKAVRTAAAASPKCAPLMRRTRGGYCWPIFWIDPYVFSPAR